MSWNKHAACRDETGTEFAHLCKACPVVRQCAEFAAGAEVRTGTWATVIFDASDLTRPEQKWAQLWRIAREGLPQQSWTPRQLRIAHSAYNQGDTHPTTLAGERVYQQRRRRVA